MNTIDKVASDPQVQAREMIVNLESEIAGNASVPGLPIKLSETPGRVEVPAPALGEHTKEILETLLGMSGTEIDHLQQSGVI